MSATSTRQKIFSAAKRIVVKVGTGAVCRETGRLDSRSVSVLARQIATAMRSGIDVTLVASGAIGAGLGEMDMPRRPRTMPML